MDPKIIEKDGKSHLIIGEAAYFCPYCGERNELPLEENCQKCGKKLPGGLE